MPRAFAVSGTPVYIYVTRLHKTSDAGRRISRKEGNMIHAVDLLTEYKKNPMGMDEYCPRFSYRVEGDCLRQTRRRIRVWKESGECVWDTGFLPGDDTAQIPYAGRTLEPLTRYFWNVAVEDEKGEKSESDRFENHFETGFMGRNWKGEWIGAKSPLGQDMLSGPARFFLDFELPSVPVKARLYSSALGLYVPFLNGERACGEDLFLPGWTNYFDRVQYQVYDAAKFLKKGLNRFAVLLGTGWFSGRIVGQWNGGTSAVGRHALFRGELHLSFADGTEKVIATDENFRIIHGDGPIRMSDIYMGETYDARRENDWLSPGVIRQDFLPRKPFIEHPGVKMSWNSGAMVRAVGEIAPVKITKMPSGVYMVDFGQNFAGRERLFLKNTFAGQTVTVRHGEMLNEDGSLYETNLRGALAVTSYTCKNASEAVYEPEFTFYGFRYLEISGWNGELGPGSVRGIVISSALPETGSFSCSDELVNRLYSNIVWGQKSNFLDVPTDCPQRDERLGWTGDTQVFCNMATWNSFAPEFYTKWLTDLNTEMTDFGCYPSFSPNPYGHVTAGDLLKEFHPYMRAGGYAAGWSDAGIICPWILYQKYMDTRLIRNFLPNILRQLDFLAANSDSFIVEAGPYRDWLNMDQPTESKFLGTACFAGTARIAAEMAQIAGREEDAARMRNLFEAVKEAFRKKFFTPEGKIFIREPGITTGTHREMNLECTQTAALLTLYFDLAPEGAEEKVLDWLVHDITVTKNNHLATGFLGTPLLLKVLTRYGREDVACTLLLQKSCPSWLYPVTQGATTMWERWNSFDHEKGFGDANMNSFNHYAYGAVGDWFFEFLCGITPCPEKSGSTPFKVFRLAPRFCKKFAHAECAFSSMSGKIVSRWKRDEKDPEKVVWSFTVPCNTVAEIVFPGTPENTNGLEKKEEGRYLARAGTYTVTVFGGSRG